MLRIDQTALLVIDMQEKLLPAIDGHESVIDVTARMIQAAKLFGLPIVHTEHCPANIGPTVGELATLLDAEPIEKNIFSCCGQPGFLDEIKKLGRPQLLLAGIECHICVGLTALDLLEAGYEVHVLSDAVGSRLPANRQVGLDRMRQAGAIINCFEMATFELQWTAGDDRFREILRLVK